MFGHHYHNIDAQLEAGQISKADYGAELLADLVNRAVPLWLACVEYAGDWSRIEAEDFYMLITQYRENVFEVRARAMRAGLCRSLGDFQLHPASAFDKSPRIEEPEHVGGLLVESAD